jgi:hypothetical protein
VVGVADDVARAVGPFPAQGGEAAVALGVEVGAQVAAEADAADDELAGLARGDGPVVGVDDGQVPARQRVADGDRVAREQPDRGRDHGGLGRAVGVPQLAGAGKPLHELLRAGLAAEDQQADGGECAVVPDRGQRRDGRDDRHLTLRQPRAEFDAGAHQRARRRHEGGAVGPRQPHLLDARVERDGQAREHAVLRDDAPQRGFAVDERDRGAVGDGDALGRAGRA